MSEREIFAAAAALPVEERAAYLDAACAGEGERRARIAERLRAHETSDFMEKSADGTRGLPEERGECIGPYRLLEKLGEGGFGAVWVAEQEQPVRRRVALKIIKLGMDTREVVARFEQERQALAMMDHPHIARVLDAGATQWGRPFFVMELVRGIKITDYCDQAKLATAERLALFIQVCQAVQHAHQKGIIHRDLKPSNILVTLHDGVPVPKVIDFGVAKAAQQRLTDLTIYTQFQQMIGTPLYMSPEQAEMSGLDIDTRSDIYSLGVLLYELLTGRTPFDPEALLKVGLDEVRRVIREQEPQTPSMFVRTMPGEIRVRAAQARQAECGKWIGQLRGDLDWITMKALEKDRVRRYETANGLAKDIERHLAGEPVLARPASWSYRFRKLVRRNTLAFGAAGIVALALIAAATLSTRSFFREKKLRQNADAQSDRAALLLYASDMNLAQQAVEARNPERARRFLDEHRPAPGEKDLRGWEWRWLWQQCRTGAEGVAGGRKLPAHVLETRALPGGRAVVAMSEKHRLSRIDLETLRETPLIGQPVVRARFAPPDLLGLYDGGRLALHEITADGLRPLGASTIGPGFETYFAYSRKSGLLAWSPAAGKVCVAPLGGGKVTALLAPDAIDYPVRFSADGRFLLVTNEVGAVRVWDTATARRLPAAERYFMPYDYFLNSFNSVRGHGLTDWTTAATAPAVRARGVSKEEAPAPAGFWPTGKQVDRAFSPDGHTFAVASGTGTVGLYDIVGPKRLALVHSHRQAIFVLAFSRDGKRLASVGRGDEAVTLWEVSTGRELITLAAEGAEFDAAEFSDDDSTLLIGEAGNCLYWRAPSWRQIEQAEAGGRWRAVP